MAGLKGGLGLWLGALGVALLELDGAHAGQFMLSRPIVLGPVLGLAFGEPGLGAGFGVLLEFLSLPDLPVGSHLPLNAAVASGSAVLLALPAAGLAPELAFPLGLGLGWVHQRLECALRRRRDRLGRVADAAWARGEDPGLGWLALRELSWQALMTLGVLTAALALLPAWRWGWSVAPEALRSGLRLALSLSPWLAIASLLHALRGVFT